MSRKRRVRRRGRELKASHIRRSCEPETLGFESTEELEPLHFGLAVQKRALDAIDLGLGLHTRGYNIFVLGEPDGGKTSTVRLLLERRAAKERTPRDLCYLHDFRTADRPRPLYLPSGQGPKLAQVVDEIIGQLQKSIPRTLASDTFGIRRQGVMREIRQKIDGLRKGLEKQASDLGFELRPDGDRLIPVPMRNEKPLGEEEFSNLSAKERSAVESAALSLRDEMAEHDFHIQRLERELDLELLEIEREAVRPLVEATVNEAIEPVVHLNGDEIPEHFKALSEHIVENHRRFMPRPIDEEDDVFPGDPTPDDPFSEYRVNVVVTQRPGKGAPVVFERQPTLGRLVGCLEYRDIRGALRADHLSIRAGALHRAAGGYLVLQANDLAKRPLAWEALKRALRDREVRTEEPEDDTRPRTAGTVRPVPTELSAKVLVLGTPEAYYGLFIGDEEFARFFKVKAEFEPSIPWSRKNIERISRFLALVREQEDQLHLDKTAVARIIEHSAREAGDQRRLSTRVASLVDLLAEADYHARKRRQTMVTAEDVKRALYERHRRHSFEEDDFIRAIREGSLLFSTSGAVVGQINGVAVYDLGDHAYGVPARITARTWVGRAGVVNIDREVELSGQIHDKGTLILIGLLGERCAQKRPLSLSASITFEQSYDLVEGDSASCAEFIALLSSLSGVPIKQGIAVTGSVDQQGEIQPVGGVNEKIEGMYRACSLGGLTGHQGVVIPERNMRHLMLSEEVVKAVEEGRFNVWTISHVDEVIELVTELPAGRRMRTGQWEPGTVNDLVDRRLAEMAESLAAHGTPESAVRT